MSDRRLECAESEDLDRLSNRLAQPAFSGGGLDKITVAPARVDS